MARRLLGQQETTIDSKGRIGLSQHLRRQFAEEVIVLKRKNHLVVLHPDDFDKVSRYIGRKFTFDSEEGVRLFFSSRLQSDRRHFFGNTFELSFDTQGRLTIPKILRDSIDLYSEVTWIGCGDYIELWANKHYIADCARREGELGSDNWFESTPPPESPSAQSKDSGDEGAVRNRE